MIKQFIDIKIINQNKYNKINIMYSKQATISKSQNLKSKLSIKDTMSNSHQIHSQPQSSKGQDNHKQENKQDCNQMKKKLFNILGKNSESHKLFKVSPTNSLKQQYFVSASLQQKYKGSMLKQNHTTENNDSLKTIKCNPVKLLKSNKHRDSNKYCEFISNNNFDMQKQFGSFVRSIDQIQADQLPMQNTERSTLIALFEKLNEKDSKQFKPKRQTLQHSESYSQKQSIQAEFVDLRLKQRNKCNFSNNSSGQLVNPNSTTTQIHQNPLISIESKIKIDENLQTIVDKTKQILLKYQAKLKQNDYEKDALIQEIQYWKSKYLKCKQQQF
ncbi:unnamed protein product [Paramecium sonneborni]|uniref:Uncharacterized protein n=1 Tax=Paramecium sonneborni TaxID=65129 RepID=A0A8S1NIP0_9CILI|nr:unnamed protein product [Paramecium sonneborni]